MVVIDYSTINLELLSQLPMLKLPETHYLGAGMGSHCYGDPPGYPTYFIRSVYSAAGNDPSRGADEVIWNPETEAYHIISNVKMYRLDENGWYHRLLNNLYIPLPEDHPRNTAKGEWRNLFTAVPVGERECNAQLFKLRGSNKNWRHPINHTRCQHCGWKKEDE